MIQTNFSNFGNSLTAVVVSEGVQSLVYGDDFDFAAVASQSLGYAIGNSLFSTVDAKEQMLEHIELQNGGGRAEAERIYQQSYSNRVVSSEDARFASNDGRPASLEDMLNGDMGGEGRPDTMTSDQWRAYKQRVAENGGVLPEYDGSLGLVIEITRYGDPNLAANKTTGSTAIQALNWLTTDFRLLGDMKNNAQDDYVQAGYEALRNNNYPGVAKNYAGYLGTTLFPSKPLDFALLAGGPVVGKGISVVGGKLASTSFGQAAIKVGSKDVTALWSEGSEAVGARLVTNSGRQISNLRTVSAETVNAEFVKNGFKPPYLSSVPPREFTTAADLDFVRVHGPTNQEGVWMVRANEIEGMSPVQIKDHLALKYAPTHISPVTVSEGAPMRVGRVGPQVQWNSPSPQGFQYELLDISKAVFQPARSFP